MIKSILVACSGNICRSPLAQGILAKSLNDAGLDVVLDSAGTGAWIDDKAPDARAVVAARVRGYDITQIRSRSLTAQDFRSFDVILTVDAEVTADVEALRPTGGVAKVQRITDFAPELGVTEVADPYYTGKFEQVIDVLEACGRGLVAQLLAERQ